MSVSTGDKFKVKTPSFVKTFGQGEPPKGLTLKADNERLYLAWGQSFEADEGLTEASAEIGGTLYVRADIVEGLMEQENSPIKRTRLATNG